MCLILQSTSWIFQLVLGKDLESIRIQNETSHGRMVQDEDMEREHRTVWGAIRNAVELAQKRAGESTVTTLETKILQIDSFTKTIESALRASIIQIKKLTYKFIQLRQWIEHLENLENGRSGREDEISLGNPQWMEVSRDKGKSPRSHT